MAQIEYTRDPAPVKEVTITLSADEAAVLATIIGRTSHYVRIEHAEQLNIGNPSSVSDAIGEVYFALNDTLLRKQYK